MKIKSMDLAWIVVDDLEEGIKYYTDIIGLKLVEKSETYGWAELKGHEGGARIGLAQCDSAQKAGTNAVLTFHVDDLNESLKELLRKNVTLEGEILEIPGHVKMQTVVDLSGNRFQLVEMLSD